MGTPASLPGDNGNGGAVRGDPRVTRQPLHQEHRRRSRRRHLLRRRSELISKSVFKGNKAASDGGAIYFFQVCAGPEGQLGFGKAERLTTAPAGTVARSSATADLDVATRMSATTPPGARRRNLQSGDDRSPEATTADPSEWGSSW